MTPNSGAGPDSSIAVANGGSQRNNLIDAARASSVLMVVLFHSLLFRVAIVDGRPVATAWEPEAAWWWPFSWVVMIIPVFFVAAGYGDAVAVDRMRTAGTDLAHYLARRGRRIVGPLLLFATLVGVAFTLVAWQSGPPPPIPYPGAGAVSWFGLATSLSRDYCFFLWFVAIYLLLLFLAPVMVTAQDRFGAGVLVTLLAGALSLDQLSLGLDQPVVRSPNVLLVWAACHQLGIAYQRGWFRTGPLWRPLLTLVAAVSTLVALITVGGYPPASVAFSNAAVANNLPPTAALALLGLAQASLLGLLERAGVLRSLGPRATRFLRRANALTVDVYLWQSTGIMLAMLLLVWLSLAWPGAESYALHPATVTLGAGLVLVGIIPPLSWLEQRLIPRLGDEQRLGHGIAAFSLLTGGTLLLWLFGGVLHPDSPWSTAGVLMIWAGAGAMARAADRTRGPRLREKR